MSESPDHKRTLWLDAQAKKAAMNEHDHFRRERQALVKALEEIEAYYRSLPKRSSNG